MALNRKAIREDLSVSSARGGKCPSAMGVTVPSPRRQPGKEFLQSQQQISLAESLGTGETGFVPLRGGFPLAVSGGHSSARSACCQEESSLLSLNDVLKAELKTLDGFFSQKHLKELHPPLDTMLSNPKLCCL